MIVKYRFFSSSPEFEEWQSTMTTELKILQIMPFVDKQKMNGNEIDIVPQIFVAYTVEAKA